MERLADLAVQGVSVRDALIIAEMYRERGARHVDVQVWTLDAGLSARVRTFDPNATP